MNVTYVISADSMTRASDIAKSRAKAEGWTSSTVIRTEQTGAREYTVYLLVNNHN